MLNRIKTIVVCIALVQCIAFSSLWGGNNEVSREMDVSVPSGMVNLPCVIICPGRGYHKDLPLIKDLADRAVEDGFAVIRFNWTFFTTKTQPSADGSVELADIAAAIQMAKQIPAVDSTRIFLAGKSMGSVLAYHSFRMHPELRACVLLTPIIPETGMGPSYYPGLAEEDRRVAFILGDNDIYNCSLPNLYDYLASVGKAIPVVVLSGGHSFEEAIEGAELVQQESTALAVETSLYWLKRMAD